MISVGRKTCNDWNRSQPNAHVTVVRRGGQVFILLASENINGNKVTLSMTVLASLRGGHVSNLHSKLETETEGGKSTCPRT